MAVVAFHVDVGPEQGWGHLQECLSVADALGDGGVPSRFLVPEGVDEAADAVESEDHDVRFIPQDWRKTDPTDYVLEETRRGEVAGLVSCLTRLPDAYRDRLERDLEGWAVITEHRDDEAAPLSFNIRTDPRYFPLDEAFDERQAREPQGAVEDLLVCFGGSDPKNATGLTLELLRLLAERGELPSRPALHVVAGPLFPHRDILEASAIDHPLDVEVAGPLEIDALADLAAGTDAAVTTGGDTMYEFSALGLPSVVVPILDKMDENAAVLEEAGAVRRLPRLDHLSARDLAGALQDLDDPGTRRDMAQAGREAVDGEGARRISRELTERWNLP